MGQLALDLPGSDSENTPNSRGVRLIHYLGNKARLIEAIRSVVNQIVDREATVCDLFSGSGVVSSALANDRFVISVDIQEYARVLGAALLHKSAVPTNAFEPVLDEMEGDDLRSVLLHCYDPLLTLEAKCIQEARRGRPDRLADLIEAGSVISLQIDGPSAIPKSVRSAYTETLKRLRSATLEESHLATSSRYFGGLFFGFRQAIDLDTLLRRIDNLPTDLRDIAKAAVLRTASEVASTVGNQFAQPLRPRNREGRPKRALWKWVADSANKDTASVFHKSLRTILEHLPSRIGGVAVKADYRDFLNSWDEPVGVFYVDPPYTRDHYSRFYHVLETLCLRDNPEVSRSNLDGGSRISRGAYRVDRHQSPFCIRSQAPDAFRTLFRLCRKFGAPVVLSYSPHGKGEGRSHPRVMRIDAIQAIAKNHYSDVRIESVDHVFHSKFTKSELHLETRELAEVLMICMP